MFLRLRVVPILLSPLCLTRKKTMTKGKRRNYRPSLRVWIMCCSHRQKYDWLTCMLGALTTHHHSRYVWCLAQMFISLSENKKNFGTEANESIGIVSHRLWCSCNSANRIWKERNLWSVLLTKFFALKLKVRVLVILLLNTRSTASSKDNLVCKIELTELIGFLPSIWKVKQTFT